MTPPPKVYASPGELLADLFDPADPAEPMRKSEKGIALYHLVQASDTFYDAANTIYALVVHAQQEFPGQPRLLYVDIDGHRNAEGGFDMDMYELQKEFAMGFLAKWLTRLHVPLGSYEAKKKKQRDDVPPALNIQR